MGDKNRQVINLGHLYMCMYNVTAKKKIHASLVGFLIFLNEKNHHFFLISLNENFTLLMYCAKSQR